jgi:hypothetical protein
VHPGIQLDGNQAVDLNLPLRLPQRARPRRAGGDPFNATLRGTPVGSSSNSIVLLRWGGFLEAALAAGSFFLPSPELKQCLAL